MDLSVDFQHVSKRYGSTQALLDASFVIGRGETVALLGPNGAGKTTAVNILLGLRQADSGSVDVLGGSPQQALSEGKVGALLQSSGLPPGTKVRELVQLAQGLYPNPVALPQLLATAGLGEIADRQVDGLSGGQTQRVRYAIAIAGNPSLLFLDEPTVGMDVESRRGFWAEMTKQSAAGRTVLFATHYLDEANDVADRIIVLRAGQVVADGSPAVIRAAAGWKAVRFNLARPEGADLAGLPGAQEVDVQRNNVLIRSNDADATVVALVQRGIEFRDLEVTGADLEDAFLALTEDRQER